MQIREASAVLLIIGQAVIGPIEARKVGNDCVLGECGINVCIPPVPRESIAKTCARAMKEIGAKRMGDDLAFIGGEQMSEATMVRCIPAPSGLVKR